MSHVLVMAKAPVAGRCKTRLCPPCTPETAAVIAEAALADTLEAVAACDAEHKIVALDGEPGSWLLPGLAVIPQRGTGLAERLANAWIDAGSCSRDGGVQIGMDTPQVTPAELNAMLALMSGGVDALLGPAVDGGWWVIGLPAAGPDPRTVFSGVPTSTAHTGEMQARRLRRLGMELHLAPVRRDIDTAVDLAAVAADIPSSRTARAARRVLPPAAPTSP